MLDGQAIQQALVNLVDNALKHSSPGQPVTIGLAIAAPGPAGATPATVVAGSPALEVSVADHGPGIPLAERERIFDRFYRLGSELRRETQGIGIGLSIVKHIAEAHGGVVRLESTVGQGSRFTLVLPQPPPNALPGARSFPPSSTP